MILPRGYQGRSVYLRKATKDDHDFNASSTVI
jgi:hypothetical protein